MISIAAGQFVKIYSLKCQRLLSQIPVLKKWQNEYLVSAVQNP